MTNEVVLIASDKDVSSGLGIRGNRDSRLPGNGADVVAERRFIKPVDREDLKREKRQELIHVDVRHDASGGNGGMGGEVLRSEEPFLLARDGHEQDG